MNGAYLIGRQEKSRGAIPPSATLPSCDGAEYVGRGAGGNGPGLPAVLNGQIPSDEMTRLIFALKEIRCLP